MTSTASIIGLIVLAYYSSIKCDPLANKDIANTNQVRQPINQSTDRSIVRSVAQSVSQSSSQPVSQSVSQSFSMEYISYLNLRLARLCDRRGEIHSRTTGLSVVKYLSRSHLECKSLTQNGIAQLHSAMFYAMVCVLYW